ncbi:DUF6009 family protein [Streptomyces alfalfae]|uniref:DUF6009 family protein n=1 Tax=Streptomyces alfalfae TaxID=1642299 RepID=UPI0039F6A5CF
MAPGHRPGSTASARARTARAPARASPPATARNTAGPHGARPRRQEPRRAPKTFHRRAFWPLPHTCDSQPAGLHTTGGTTKAADPRTPGRPA